MSVIRDLARFVCDASVRTLPDAERAIQRRHVADTLIAAVAGSRTSEGRALRQILPRDALPDVIGLQTAVIRHTEIDDIHTRSCTTPSSVTVPAAFSLAQAASDFEPERVASAVWVGTELLTRLGIAINGASVLYRGVWPTYFAAPLAAAAIAARIWRMKEDRAAHALSLALMLSAGRSGRFQGAIPGRSVILAMAVAAGIKAAAAAREGVGGDLDLLDGPWLRDAHGIDANVEIMTTGLGARSVYSELSLKPFCSAKQAIAAVEALMSVLDDGIAPETIESVRVSVPPPYARMIATKPQAGARASTIVSAAFQMGLAAHNRARLYDIERNNVLAETAALEFAGKVEIAPNEALLDSFPVCFPAEIEVRANRKRYRKRVNAALGDPPRALDDAQIKDKAERVLRPMDARLPAAGTVALGLAALSDRAACERVAETIRTTME
jgi:2-methylcitrate dehydratase PrpD